ncbi:hypothetical protein EDD17DRAFT_1541340 [Pisolithus thermaeus]|nr:hypothetical protein EDD17DRAFT_1541272 [Pisolithus thermaeus]KAI6167518.1 hypothetical protein EDD17DRAFT_1541325 [Pisolithus thermaeus]KAI6167519.1 hypothetical protein EDD17DRAFT_1541340 [Pisolithus thermaeus]
MLVNATLASLMILTPPSLGGDVGSIVLNARAASSTPGKSSGSPSLIGLRSTWDETIRGCPCLSCVPPPALVPAASEATELGWLWLD